MHAIIAISILFLFLLMSAIRIFREYERGVIFRLGRLVGTKGPGLVFIIPIIDKVVRVSLRTIAMDVPPQDIITKDNVSVEIDGFLFC